ncbi:PKD domain-containing protein [Sphingobacterium endophyticum]|uniref:PKD domain-containing protein n=1 Tax=Sphingobacterium endophyticum TaxID=2546448 RepID=UPI0018CF26A9|nr:PKD domain-containing protein [Sphingobacterium endophyticum]
MKYVFLCLALGLLSSSCKKDQEPVPEVIEKEPKPTAAFTFAQVNQNDPFTFKFDNKATNFKETRWSFGDDSTASVVTPTHTFLNTGTYVVKLVALNGEGYWAQREETIRISAANLIKVTAKPAGAGKLNLAFTTAMSVAKTEWKDGYESNGQVLSTEKTIDLQFDPGTFKEVQLKLTTSKGSIAALNLFVSELGIIKDITTFENSFSVSHENSGGPDAGEGSKKMIDGDITTKLFVGGVGNNMSWQFAYQSPQILNGYSMTSGNDSPDRDPKSWKVEGSIDGETWITVDQRTNEFFTERRQSRTFLFTNKTPYNYYRFSMTELNGGSNFQMSEIRVLEFPQ